MFQQRLRPLEQLERRVVAIRYSLNEPIVATAELPAGPARAAILVYLEDNIRRVVVVIRSLSRARVVQYEMRGEEFAEATGMAFDAGLSFSESMGFLFDDEKLANTPREERGAILALLQRLLDPSEAMRPAASLEEEILLETDPVPASDLELTKFRASPKRASAPRAATPPADAETSSATENPTTTLGRVQPIRKRAPEPPALSPKLKLLASF